jgi:hypothetical protein
MASKPEALTEDGLFSILQQIQTMDVLLEIDARDFETEDEEFEGLDIMSREQALEKIGELRTKFALYLLDHYQLSDYIVSDKNLYSDTNAFFVSLNMIDMDKLLKHIQVMKIVCFVDANEDCPSETKYERRQKKQERIDSIASKLLTFIIDNYSFEDYELPKQFLYTPGKKTNNKSE